MAELSRLPGTNIETWEWQHEGSCVGMNSEKFFHPELERGPRKQARIDAAKEVCASCPVLQQCLNHALTVREPYGIWGGKSEDELREMYAARTPGKRSQDAA